MLALTIQWGFRPWLNSVKASGEPLDFLMVFYRASERCIRAQTRRSEFIMNMEAIMEKQLIFFDIDGTLLDDDKKLPESTKYAVQRLKELGHEVAIATGRSPHMFRGVTRGVGD